MINKRHIICANKLLFESGRILKTQERYYRELMDFGEFVQFTGRLAQILRQAVPKQIVSGTTLGENPGKAVARSAKERENHARGFLLRWTILHRKNVFRPGVQFALLFVRTEKSPKSMSSRQQRFWAFEVLPDSNLCWHK